MQRQVYMGLGVYIWFDIYHLACSQIYHKIVTHIQWREKFCVSYKWLFCGRVGLKIGHVDKENNTFILWEKTSTEEQS